MNSVHIGLFHRKTILLPLILALWPVTASWADKLERQPGWKQCLNAGGTVQSCARQMRGVGQQGGVSERSATDTGARVFSPSPSLSAAQEARVNTLIGGHSLVQSNRAIASNALWYGQDARSRAITADSIARDGRNRAINAQSRADQAASWTYRGGGPSVYYIGCHDCASSCPPGFYRSGSRCYRR